MSCSQSSPVRVRSNEVRSGTEDAAVDRHQLSSPGTGAATGSISAQPCCHGGVDRISNQQRGHSSAGRGRRLHSGRSCRTYIFSGSPSGPQVAATQAALEILEQDPSRVGQLQANADFLRHKLTGQGLRLAPSQRRLGAAGGQSLQTARPHCGPRHLSGRPFGSAAHSPDRNLQPSPRRSELGRPNPGRCLPRGGSVRLWRFHKVGHPTDAADFERHPDPAE